MSMWADTGWCAPGDHYALTEDTLSRITMPEVTAKRGGLDYNAEQSPAEKARHEQARRIIDEMVERFAAVRRHAINTACVTAMVNDWDVHIYEPPRMSYTVTEADFIYMRAVGVGFTPAEHPVPTIVFHQPPDFWDEGEWD
jgi:hypothetical protein